jgi:hypothetical protein
MRRTAGDLYDELIAKGRAEGRAEARAEAKAKGMAEGMAECILQIGERLFGAASDRIRERLFGLSPEQLVAVTDRLLQVSSWEEALGGAPPT